MAESDGHPTHERRDLRVDGGGADALASALSMGVGIRNSAMVDSILVSKKMCGQSHENKIAG